MESCKRVNALAAQFKYKRVKYLHFEVYVAFASEITWLDDFCRIRYGGIPVKIICIWELFLTTWR